MNISRPLPWHYQLQDRKGQALAFPRFIKKRKEILSVPENVNNRASSPLVSTSHTEETDKCQAFNHELLAFPKLRDPETLSPLERWWQRKDMQRITGTNCHLQYITFNKWNSYHATLPHSNQGQTLALNELSHCLPCLYTQTYWFCYFLPDGWTWVDGIESTSQQQKVIKLLPKWHVNAQRWNASPSVHVQVHLFHRFILSIYITIYTVLTGFYIIHYNFVLINQLKQPDGKLSYSQHLPQCLRAGEKNLTNS